MSRLAQDDVARAAGHLRRGGIVAFPTETVYGLGADAFNEAAVQRVFALKGRPPSNPLIVHVTGRDMARAVVSSWPEAAERLARAFWPGPLTLVLPKAPGLPGIVTAGGETAAVRCPDHPVALALLFAFDGPLVGPSANPSGRVSPTRAEHVRESFSGEEVIVLDAGPCVVGVESTVLDLCADRPRILRRGVVGPEAIAGVLGIDPVSIETAAAAGPSDPGAPLRSPGRLSVHYAPAAPAALFDSARWPEVRSLADAAAARGGRIALLTHTSRRLGAPHAVFAMPRDAAAYAATLYDALRQADALAPELVAVERPPEAADDPGEAATWAAIQDRLARATRPL